MTIDNQRLLQYSVYGLALVVWFVLWKLLAGTTSGVFMLAGWEEPAIPLFQSISNIMAFVAVAGTAVAAEAVRRHPVTNRFGVECLAELRKVSWPSWKEIRGTTLVVLGVTLVISVILFLFDSIYASLIKLIYPGGA